MAGNKRDRKWVVRAMVAFVLVLALLTFFSNTIMNATIPKVTGVNAVRGNLSHTNSASSQIEVANKIDLKGIEGREVDRVLLTDYDYVHEGDVILTLKPLENQDELDDLNVRLLELQRQAEYAERTPNEATDYTALREGITSANLTLQEAQETLAAAQNRDQTIAAAQQIINDNQGTVVALEAQVTSCSDTVEEINAQISELQSQIATLDSQINVFVTLGTPTPTPSQMAPTVNNETDEGNPGMMAVAPVADPADVPGDVPADVPSETTPVETEAPAPVTPAAPDRTQIDLLCSQKADLERQIGELQSQLADAQGRLGEASAQLATVNATIGAAEASIEMAEQLPSVAQAQSAVNLAQSGVTQAQQTYNHTMIQDGITQDQAQDAIEDRNRQMENLERQIADLEKKINATEIVATADGYVYGMTLTSGDVMTDGTIATIIPENPECTISFTFSAQSAQSLNVGMELSTDNWWVNRCTIINIKPDPQNPRENRIVKCELEGDNLYPGETITVTADRSNATFDHVVPSSAVNEDNSGTFVYVIQQSSSPLGDKYVVKRITVTVENTDGSLSAISGEGLDEGMIVTRAEKPLHDGDRVRLEDYSGDNK